ncbi:16S rRNA (adenine(1518)-N(6)/adenine(1519)-N(6))-dimethyltransferase RsmA [Vineibacter terrae]|uniref:16S rRNA (adenine(1518)-N(6)/adenine(1519)-N(6))- dimethyltransferase RsmA n=1 Tax=Vineibacter terrae TaxID=2586908 RepID=UPI002E3266C0|nr:16S rRNA (adenine(1518)-N(6)/adenine(1519)-N(6))-dimethyltransferase RsmA [Vineibacter terrae]HEX2886978.1 16S rRNA (adenine(1518)-N(6)/adenine(1519)-N(6))-dimethyltransferase RsmA [Vineibacter terrae]
MTLPPLREVIARHGLAARKSLGQHFLLDLNLTDRIARAAGDLSAGTTIEVGPGPGGLTRSLIRQGAARLVCIERDARAVAVIGELAAAFPGRIEVIEADALTIDLATLGPAPRRIVANLPYNISTALLTRWLHAAPALESMTLMFQKEVVDRLIAPPRTKDYGRLSVLTQVVCAVTRLFDIAPSAFVPPPRVVSTVARLVPHAPAAAPAVDLHALEAVTAAAFGQRRKMLRTSLRAAFPTPEAALAACGIPPTARAEDLEPSQFVALASHKRLQSNVLPKK